MDVAARQPRIAPPLDWPRAPASRSVAAIREEKRASSGICAACVQPGHDMCQALRRFGGPASQMRARQRVARRLLRVLNPARPASTGGFFETPSSPSLRGWKGAAESQVRSVRIILCTCKTPHLPDWRVQCRPTAPSVGLRSRNPSFAVGFRLCCTRGRRGPLAGTPG